MNRHRSKAKTKGRMGRGLARSRTQARVQAEEVRRQAKGRPTIDDPRIEAAILEMNRGRSLTAAARASHISRQRLRKILVQRRLAKRKGRRWFSKDNRLRQVPVITRGRVLPLPVPGYEQARLVGEHTHAVGAFLSTNDVTLLKPFEGRIVQAVNGRRYVLETDPNTLHRIAAMDSPPFHEIYEITSST
jgi:hypothetical protein